MQTDIRKKTSYFVHKNPENDLIIVKRIYLKILNVILEIVYQIIGLNGNLCKIALFKLLVTKNDLGITLLIDSFIEM
jgi:hypothetical protein